MLHFCVLINMTNNIKQKETNIRISTTLAQQEWEREWWYVNLSLKKYQLSKHKTHNYHCTSLVTHRLRFNDCFQSTCLYTFNIYLKDA